MERRCRDERRRHPNPWPTRRLRAPPRQPPEPASRIPWNCQTRNGFEGREGISAAVRGGSPSVQVEQPQCAFVHGLPFTAARVAVIVAIRLVGEYSSRPGFPHRVDLLGRTNRLTLRPCLSISRVSTQRLIGLTTTRALRKGA